ncbi:methionine aminotransferase [Nonlabens sp. SY33080]|uniref:methionine aminotransferase n=1 Tax=Nonlabens sp. SY33080 TaxID=2719911 RepID=UPI001428C8EE|nr:methionine aminotransferase [Nonlabens sp. SY33080]
MINSKLPHVSTTIFTVMSDLAREHGAINLSQGFPSFSTDDHLKSLIKNAITNDHNQYAPMQGLLSIRVSLSNLIHNCYGAIYRPDDEICITAGATQAIFTAIQAIVHPGDEVIYFTPAYDCYEPAIQLAGGIPVPISMDVQNFTIDWDLVKQKISNKTVAIIINTPHNPSGTVMSKEDMLCLQKLVVDHGLICISDEVYEHIVFDDNKHMSAASFEGLKERSFIIGSFGKTYHITGWKTGYCVASKVLMKEFLKVHQYLVFCVNHPIQVALAEYLKTPKHYLELGIFYQRKRDLFLSLLKDSVFKFTPAQGSYFQLLDYSSLTNEHDVSFAKRLTIENKIASIPISVFMSNYNTKKLRFCFAKKDDELIQAANILKAL